jgi:hypothetical protein
MELSRRPCIVSVGAGGAYPFGVDRLERSLNFHGWAGETVFYRGLEYGWPQHIGDQQYGFKLFAMERSFAAGRRVVLWCDSSLYAIKDPMPIFDYICDKGIFLFKSGYPLSATATDRMLEYSGEKRSGLKEVPEFATGCVGIDVDSTVGYNFLKGWLEYYQAGLFGGSRSYNPSDSKDPGFLFSRQDQSAASMVLHKMGITEAGHEKEWVSYYPSETKNTIFFVKGL